MDITPDSLPVIDKVERIPGVTLATGFSGHGFGTAPAAGQLAADLVTGGTPIVDPTPYRLARLQQAKRFFPTARFPAASIDPHCGRSQAAFALANGGQGFDI